MADYFNFGANGQQMNTGQMKNGQTGYYNTFADVGSPGQNGLDPTQQQNLQNYGYSGNNIATGNSATGSPWETQAPAYGGAPAMGTPAGGGSPMVGSAGGSYGAPGPANGGGNPYLEMQGGAIARRMNDNMQRNVMPQVQTAAMAAGGYGDSRHGVLEANLYKDMNLGLGDSLANLYGTDWTNQQNRELTNQGQQMNFYTAQRGQDQTGAALGADLMRQGQQGQWGGVQNAAQAYSPFTGLGTTTNNTSSGGGAMGAVGGALSAAAMGKQMGWWG